MADARTKKEANAGAARKKKREQKKQAVVSDPQPPDDESDSEDSDGAHGIGDDGTVRATSARAHCDSLERSDGGQLGGAELSMIYYLH